MDRRPVSVVSSRVAACRADRSPALFLQKVDRRGRAQQLDEIGAEAAPDMEPQRRRIESLAGGDVGNVDVEEEAGHRRYHSPLLGIDAHGSAGASAAPACSNSIEMASGRSEEHTSELQSLMRISYAVF